MYKKVCCTCKVAFLLIRPIVVFNVNGRALPSPLSITPFYILFEQTIKYYRELRFLRLLKIYILNIILLMLQSIWTPTASWTLPKYEGRFRRGRKNARNKAAPLAIKKNSESFWVKLTLKTIMLSRNVVNINSKISHLKCNFTPVYQRRVEIVDDLSKKKTAIANSSAQIHCRYIWEGCLSPS